VLVAVFISVWHRMAFGYGNFVVGAPVTIACPGT
jgi:hypothetical protein